MAGKKKNNILSFTGDPERQLQFLGAALIIGGALYGELHDIF